MFYDNSTVIREINGTLYNALGIVVSKLKKSDIKDYSAFSDYTIFSDSRVKTAGTFVKVYPYTIEYEYSVEENGVISFDTWLPQYDYKIAVQSSWLEFTTPESIPFRYKNLNISDSVVTRKNGNNTSYIWQVKT
ncbi:MAG: DUF3857 domain-containing protein [Bacteroidales bacterium]|nr:DUF3857 domain-containing protein [Bacteroidales bacterium]